VSDGAGLRSPLGRAVGLGSAKEGVGHWWAQRLGSLALVPLGLWFAGSVIALAGAPHAEFVAWLSSPLAAILMVLLLAIGFHHLAIGIQVVIEDYVHHEGAKIAALVVVKAACAVLAVAGIFAVLKIAFTAGGAR
jgi:succinate dehydrogenase / fumarate reductase, membrane anchor subunit